MCRREKLKYLGLWCGILLSAIVVRLSPKCPQQCRVQGTESTNYTDYTDLLF